MMVLLIAAVIWGSFIWCMVRSRKASGNMLHRVSFYIYKRIHMRRFIKRKNDIQEQKVMQTLSSLNPGMDRVVLLTEYYTEKIRVILLILLLGSAVAFFEGVVGRDVALPDGILERPEKMQSMTLEATVIGEGNLIKEKILLDINEKSLSEKEAEELCRELLKTLGERIVGSNPSLQEVRLDLELPSEVEGYPFFITWKSDSELLDREGKVYLENLDHPVGAILEATISYGEYEWRHNFELVLCPLQRTERQRLIYELTQMGRTAESEHKYENNVTLPEKIEGNLIQWKIVRERSGEEILFITLFAAIIVFFVKDKDLQKEVIQRRIKMKLEYPSIVSKYALLLEAGLTVRNAFMKICLDYYDKKPKSIQPIYEEMYYSCNELRTGISESRVYENFGRRTGTQEYTRLCGLLSQNLKKGNTALVLRLREEYEGAVKENLQLKKRQGEEAGTKMLLPMGMLLIMILMMIMLPAFSGLNL